MLNIDEAIAKLHDHLPQPQRRAVNIRDAHNMVLADAVVSREPSPRFTNSAMDGYAVRWEDVAGASAEHPVILRIAGESQAGVPLPGALNPAEAARISTGAALMPGADTVVPIEEIQERGPTIAVMQVHHPFQNLRREGEEFTAGVPLLAAGSLLTPSRIALLASQGIHSVDVYTTPALAIVSTGTELVPYEQQPGDGQIRDSNRLMLSLACANAGATVCYSNHVEDQLEATLNAINEAEQAASIILFSGGVSVGPHDLVKQAAAGCGFETVFWRVKQKPGKPLLVAQKNRQTLLFGLPGNPVSSYICFMYYVQPAIHHLRGLPFQQAQIEAEAGETIINRLDRTHLMRVRLQHRPGNLPLVQLLPKQGSHMLTSVSAAAGFVRVDAGESLPAGARVKVIPLM